MYLSYWGLKEKPFENTPDPKFLYYSVRHKEALLNLLYAVNENKGAALLTGDIGCGKTLLARALISRLDPDDFEVALVANPRLDENDFVREILYQFGQNSDQSNRLNVIMTRIGAIGLTRQSAAEKYNAAHASALRALEGVEDQEWDLGVDYPGWDRLLNGHVTLERLFRYLAIHFQVHAEQIRQGLVKE